jgi:hypothetical protein
VSSTPGRNQELEVVAQALPGTTEWPDTFRQSGDWLLMMPFLLILILTTVLALAVQDWGVDLQEKIPPLAKIWPKRHVIIAALSVVALTLVVLQSLNGFSLERAARVSVRENPLLKAERTKAEGNEWKLAAVEHKEERLLTMMGLHRTIWMHLAVACLAFGTLAAIGSLLLERRGDKPPPKILLLS